MLHDGLQKLATAGAESMSMFMTICVGASPPPIELARAAACPARFARLGRAGLFPARLLPSLEPDETRLRFSHFTAVYLSGEGGVFLALLLTSCACFVIITVRHAIELSSARSRHGNYCTRRAELRRCQQRLLPFLHRCHAVDAIGQPPIHRRPPTPLDADTIGQRHGQRSIRHDDFEHRRPCLRCLLDYRSCRRCFLRCCCLFFFSTALLHRWASLPALLHCCSGRGEHDLCFCHRCFCHCC